MKIVLNFLKQEKSIPIILALVALAIALQRLNLGVGGYNNYIIFKTSFFHLIQNKDLYLRYPDEYNDLFLYTPTFAFLMAPLAYLPMFLQVILWCGLISFMGYSAIKSLPFDNSKKRIWLLWLILIEFITAMQNMQTAGIVASLIILGFAFLEKDQPAKASLFLLLAAFIKIYALASLVLFLLYPKKIRFILFSIIWGIVLLALPLIVISFKQLSFLYQSWYHLTLDVHQSEEMGANPNIVLPLSVMTWLKSWFHLNLTPVYVQITGTVVLLLPYLRLRLYKNLQFRAFLLASILVWAMIFNHIAESPSYIVAVFGAAVWFVYEDKNWVTTALIALAIVFTSLESTDILPSDMREKYFDPYVIKAVPCILIWFFLQYRLLFMKGASTEETIPVTA